MNMNIFSVLKDEHKTVKELFEKILDTTERAEKTRTELYPSLYRELLSHAKVEEEVFYKRFEQEKGMEHLLAEAKEEHAQAEKLLQELAEMDPTTIEWTAKLTV